MNGIGHGAGHIIVDFFNQVKKNQIHCFHVYIRIAVVKVPNSFIGNGNFIFVILFH
jgi:hypothetical protein